MTDGGFVTSLDELGLSATAPLRSGLETLLPTLPDAAGLLEDGDPLLGRIHRPALPQHRPSGARRPRPACCCGVWTSACSTWRGPTWACRPRSPRCTCGATSAPASRSGPASGTSTPRTPGHPDPRLPLGRHGRLGPVRVHPAAVLGRLPRAAGPGVAIRRRSDRGRRDAPARRRGQLEAVRRAGRHGRDRRQRGRVPPRQGARAAPGGAHLHLHLPPARCIRSSCATRRSTRCSASASGPASSCRLALTTRSTAELVARASRSALDDFGGHADGERTGRDVLQHDRVRPDRGAGRRSSPDRR